MRGIVLAGGTGSRLSPVTKAVNKHCLLVYDKPMIHYPIQVLKDNGIKDITIVSSPQGIGQISSMLGGEYTYRVQEGFGGIPQALLAAKTDSKERVAIILGDNIFLPSPKISNCDGVVQCFLYGKLYSELKQLGVAVLDNSKKMIGIDEKPDNPRSCWAVTGLYSFDHDVFNLIPSLHNSKRGEQEIADVLRYYIVAKRMAEYKIEGEGFWGDAGTFEGIYNCSGAIKYYEEK